VGTGGIFLAGGFCLLRFGAGPCLPGAAGDGAGAIPGNAEEGAGRGITPGCDAGAFIAHAVELGAFCMGTCCAPMMPDCFWRI